MKAKEIAKKIRSKITTAYIAKIAVLSAISFVLYMYAKFNLPFMFPAFLDIQFSELPALLAGFSMGPFAGALVIIIKCLIKLPFSSTAMVGELMDIILGLTYILPASIIYNKKKTRKSAVVGLAVGTLSATVLSMLFNRVIAIPFYVTLYFNNNFDNIVNMLSALYPGLTRGNFYNYYIFLGVLPFNLLRLGLVSIITFLVYKRLSKLLHWEIPAKKKNDDKSAAQLTENAERQVSETKYPVGAEEKADEIKSDEKDDQTAESDCQNEDKGL